MANFLFVSFLAWTDPVRDDTSSANILQSRILGIRGCGPSEQTEPKAETAAVTF
jgi:hypothetical protein